MSNVIHLCDCGRQPAIRIACDQSWGVPAWDTVLGENKATVRAGEVYLLDNDKMYTFDEKHVTCPSCLKKSLTDS